MTWIDVAWTMMASASLTLGLIHLLVWTKRRSEYAQLVFFVLAASVAVFGAFELLAARAQTPAEYAWALRWAHVPLTVAVLAILGFVHLYFNAGRPWLAYAAAGFRLLALVSNFVTGVNVNFRDITELAHVTVRGEAVLSVPIGILNSWNVVAQISNVLLAAFVVDASVSLWRRGGVLSRRRALLVGGSLILCIVAAAGMANLTLLGVLRAPILLTPCFLIVVLAMGYELGWDVVRAAELSRELRESERRIELAALAAELTFWSWDTTRDDVWITSKGRDLFEFSDSERIGLDAFLGRVHPDDRDAVGGALKGTLRDGDAFEREFRLALPSGNVRWIAARGQAEVNRDGALLRGVALDVTARRRQALEAAQQRSELAHLSRVATLGELSGSLAHEINQPLMGILSNAQAAQRFLASDDVHLDEVREILVDIVEDDKRAGEVIRRLRALLKRGEVQHAPLDIGKVIDDVLRLMRNDLMNRNVAASTDLTPDLPQVLGDRIQLQQVLINLVINACEAMVGVRGTSKVNIRAGCAHGASVEVSVSDRGGGIPPGDLERIFEPFVSTKEHGTGLGLSICRSIITTHGGRLWAENNGDGATFRFTLPVIREEA